MADFGDYPPNLTVKDALIIRESQGPDHAVVPYTGSDLLRAQLGPANPFRATTSSAVALASASASGSGSGPQKKRKNVLTGHAEETFISEHTFRAKHRAVERAGAGGPQREGMSNREQKELHKRLRMGREGKGDATVADGDGAYVGPWARYTRERYETVEVGEGEEEEEELGSGEEYEVVEEDEEDEIVPSGTLVQAPAPSLARRREAEELGEETTAFLGESEHDYLGRTYMHVPQDLDFSLTKEVGSVANFIPKKLVYTWKPHGKPVTAMQLFPRSSHLGLSGGADGMIKIWDVYRKREVLRSFAGHNKAVTDLSFNNDGTKFLSGGFDRRIRLWDTETGQCINRFNCGKTPHVIKFNPSAENGHEFLAGLSDNRILQYDSRTGNETIQDYDHHLGAINTIEFIDENRRFMSTSDDRSLRVWEYGIPVEIKTISEPDMFALTKSAQHPSGKYVLYQCSDNSIVAYSIGSEKFRQHRKKAWRGHNTAGSAIGLTCSPDGQFVASGDTGGSVCFWDFKTCKMYGKITVDGSGGSVNCVAWSEQETSKVFTAGAKGEIKLWD
ncbi:WD40-repeat-containing domain protein [Chaetomium fimeti]|uniref:WD40-repeat-containing domain protein n=1 Tax=Chaetomium fimeti TaxID=1854472 RepID=A0AAE0HA80_9PEZI|nr:WD40-repeat-containing domain protein [Chaetomium fimeti]